MPKPKGCRCPYKCPVHPDRVPTVREGESVKHTVTPVGERPGAKKPKSAKPSDPDFSGVEDAVKRATAGKSGEDQKPPDPPPRSGKRSGTGAKAPPTTKELEEVLSELLVMPAIPAKALLHCDFCMAHFLTSGPPAAAELAVISETNPPLRRALEKLHELYGALLLGGVLGSYFAKPMIHHLAPAEALEAIGPVLGIPPRPESVPHSHNGSRTEKPKTPSAAASQSTGAAGTEPIPPA